MLWPGISKDFALDQVIIELSLFSSGVFAYVSKPADDRAKWSDQPVVCDPYPWIYACLYVDASRWLLQTSPTTMKLLALIIRNQQGNTS